MENFAVSITIKKFNELIDYKLDLRNEELTDEKTLLTSAR